MSQNPDEAINELETNPKLQDLKNEIDSLRYDQYTVISGDNPGSIAEINGITVDGLIFYNSYLGNNFKTKNGNRVIELGKIIFIPTNIEAFKIAYEKISKKLEILRNNTRIDIQSLKSSVEFFPSKPQTIGFGKYLDGFRISQENQLDPRLPRVVDELHEKQTTCANFVRRLMGQSVNNENLTEEEKNFLQEQGIDAWMLPERLKDIGFRSEQKFNLMEYFDESKIGQEDPLDDGEGDKTAYWQSAASIGKELKDNDEKYKGAFVPYYFQHSHYKNEVKNYNLKQEEKHYNTHQSVFIGNGTVNFKPSEIQNIVGNNSTFIDVIQNFVLNRADYGGSLGGHREGIQNKIKNNLIKYLDFIDIEITSGGETTKVDKNNFDDISNNEIAKDATIKITSPMMIDGEKQANSDDPERKDKMNGRTRFYFEFLLTDYLPTELLVPPEDSAFGQNNPNKNLDGLEVIGVYDLREGEILANKLKEQIKIRLKKEDGSEPNKGDINQEYGKQIKALQLAGFTQDGIQMNKGAANINRAIPYFDTSNIDDPFNKHIEDKRKEFKKDNKEDAEIKEIIFAPVFPGDTDKMFFKNLKEYLEDYIPKGDSTDPIRSNLYKIRNLNPLQKDIFISLLKQNLNIKGDLEAYKTFVIKIKDINEILENIDKPTDLKNEDPELELNQIKVDERQQKVLDTYIPNKYNRSLLNLILRIESGEGGRKLTNLGISRKDRKRVSEFLGRNGDNLPDNLEKKLEKYKATSLGNFQLNLGELKKDVSKWDKNNWPNCEFPTLENLTNAVDNALNYYNKLKSDPDYETSFFGNKNLDCLEEDKSNIDLIKNILDNLKQNIDTLNQEEISVKLKEIYKLLKEVIRISTKEKTLDNIGENILGDVISASLLNNKLDTHISKLSYNLQNAGEKDFLRDPEQKRSFDKLVIDINNRGEEKVMYSVIENYIIRTVGYIVPETGVYKLYKDPTKKLLKGGFIDYSKEKFTEHVHLYLEYLETVNPRTKNIEILISKLDKLNKINPMNLESCYEFVKDQEVKQILISEGKPRSLLPTQEEFFHKPFQIEVFAYANKVDKVDKYKKEEE